MFNIFKKSFEEFKNSRTIVICGFLLALSLILGTFSINIGNTVVISFSFIANTTAAFLFGPVVSSILAGLTDILNHVIAPKGAYFFGFTFNALISGLIYGCFLYRKQFQNKNLILRIAISKILVGLIINLGLGTLWVTMISGKGFLLLLPVRFSKEIITIPIHSLVMFILFKSINKYYNSNSKLENNYNF